MHSRIIKKLSAVSELLYSSRNADTYHQIVDKYKMLVEVHEEYNSLLSLEMQAQDEEWFDEVDENMLSFKNKIHS